MAVFASDIHYVDASKLFEQPITVVKAEINYWFDKCAWHRPSMLILDNLDKLLGAELEVCLCMLCLLRASRELPFP